MAFRDVTTRGRTRICFSYGLAPRIPLTVPGKRISEAYDFGRIASHMDSAGDLLPRVVIDWELPAADPDCSQPTALPSFPPMYNARALLTMTPRGDAVLVIDGDLIKPVTPQVMAKVLAETCFKREDIQINGLPVMAWLRARLEEIGVRTDDLKFGNDVHQCVFPGGALQDRFRAQDPVSVNHAAAELLYRGTVPVGDTESLLHIYLPPGLNNSGNTFAAHGRGVSIFSGWAANLENSFILTAISTISALGALRLSRHESFAALALAQDAAAASARNARTLVSQLSDRLNEMQLDMSFGVEAHIDSILIPEMVVEAFQRSLSESVGLRDSLDNTSRMLQRVGSVISARLAKLEALDRERIERRDRLVAIMVAVASLLALPPALLLAFFGINAAEVHSSESIFNMHAYWVAWALAWLPFIALVSIGGFLYSRIRRR